MDNSYCDILPEVWQLAGLNAKNGEIESRLYSRYDVKRGLRDNNGRGVLTGLTRIAEVKSYTIDDDETIPCDGKLYYRGYNINDLVAGFTKGRRFGFEEVAYLLIFGELPSSGALREFRELLAEYRTLPQNFVRDVIMKAPTNDMMNTLARGVLTLYCYDTNANDISTANVLRQCIQLIANFPVLSVYGYQAYRHMTGDGLFIHTPQPELSCAENILYMLREDKEYTELEAHVLDVCLVLHADHGGGNNATFTNHVVTSTGTDTYSAMAASLSSLKGPRHGGANLKVMDMMTDIKKHVKNWDDDGEIGDYLHKLLCGEAFDKSGLIYGIGHAVYTLSDPRAEVLRGFAADLSREKGKDDEMKLYRSVERLSKAMIAAERGENGKPVATNVDFYSGFVYDMLSIPRELYTPMFAVARIAGWSAHRLEELSNGGKIIRPAYKCVEKRKEYVPMSER